jgi:putative protease
MTMELLAPAGGPAALEAALAAGADAVYLGLPGLNARRGAENFAPASLPRAVGAARAAGARVYLTLNIDLGPRETGQAARQLALARDAGVAAVLVRDPALLRLREHFPDLAFHWSTQAAVASRDDVLAAKRLGADRVVLAREMSLPEIKAASAVPGVGTEVFVQGALCFAVSGRCWLSSWGGGRSGNRGACTSPCRVPWTRTAGAAAPEPETPFAMHDLAVLERLKTLERAGVRAVKIEGRLKTPEWVGRAVTLYRRALDGESPDALRDALAALADCSGREFTAGYLDGKRTRLTATAARPGAETASDAPPAAADGARDAAPPGEDRGGEPSDYTFRLLEDPKGFRCRVETEARTEEWTLPRSRVRRPEKALRVQDLLVRIEQADIQGFRLARAETDLPEALLPPRVANRIMDRLSAALHTAARPAPETVRIDLAPAVREALGEGPAHPANSRRLGEAPRGMRLRVGQLRDALRDAEPELVVVEGAAAGDVPALAEHARGRTLAAALPLVTFEEEREALAALVRACAEAGIPLEANSWGGWRLAEEAGAAVSAGPGLGILNPLAARTLADLGFTAATVSVEAGREEMEALAARAPVPLRILVRGRPVLAVSRVRLPAVSADRPARYEDRRNIRLEAREEGGLTVFRPLEPFDISRIRNDRVRAACLVADLSGDADPAQAWKALQAPAKAAPSAEPLSFNYSRGLF